MRRALICIGELGAGWEAIGPSPVLFPDKARGPDVALAPGRPSLWPKTLTRLGRCSGRQELVVSPQVGIPGVGPAAAALTGQETGAERGYLGGGGRGVSWEGGGAEHVGIPTEFPPGKTVEEAWAPQNRGRSASYLGGGRGRLLLVPSRGLPRAAEAQVRLPRQGRLPHPSRGAGVPGAAPRRAHLQGLQRAVYPAACPSRGASRSVPDPAPRCFSVWKQGAPGRTPHPATPAHFSDGHLAGDGLAKVAGKARPRRPAPPPSPVPGPRRVALTMLAPLPAPRGLQFPRADSNPSRHRLRARLRGGPERPGGRGRGKRGRAGERAGGRQSRIGEGGTRSAALARLPQRRRENPA